MVIAMLILNVSAQNVFTIIKTYLPLLNENHMDFFMVTEDISETNISFIF